MRILPGFFSNCQMPSYTHAEIITSSYKYLPNLPANMVGLVMYSLTFILQILFGTWTKQWWFLVCWFCATGLEVAGFSGRVASYYELQNKEAYKAQLVGTILAPAFHMAGIYYQLAKIITIYGQRFSPLKPMTYSAIFIVADVVSIVIQAAGGGTAAGGDDDNDRDTIRTGGWIMVAGIAVQVVMMSIFILAFSYVIWKIKTSNEAEYESRYAHVRRRPMFKFFIPALCVAILFIYIRSIYRLVELSEGWTGYLMTTERFFLVLDGLMVLIATVTLTVVHPGFCLGRDTIPVEGLHYKRGQAPPHTDEDEDKLNLYVAEEDASY